MKTTYIAHFLIPNSKHLFYHLLTFANLWNTNENLIILCFTSLRPRLILRLL
jgi:hypothetical protein